MTKQVHFFASTGAGPLDHQAIEDPAPDREDE
jgi:hypothetical protein